jgi:hypothetical protein
MANEDLVGHQEKIAHRVLGIYSPRGLPQGPLRPQMLADIHRQQRAFQPFSACLLTTMK